MAECELSGNEVSDLRETEEWETLFAHRYTTEDKVFMEVKNKVLPPQPTVHPWHVQQKLLRRGYQWSRNRQSNQEFDRNRDWDRNRERDRNRGSSSRSQEDRSRSPDRSNHYRSRSYRDCDDRYSRQTYEYRR